MSHPAIGIGHPVSDPPARGLVVKDSFTTAAPAAPDLMVRYSRIPICHTEFGIRNPRIGNRGTEISHGAVFSLLTT